MLREFPPETLVLSRNALGRNGNLGWDKFVSNESVLHETGMSPVTCTIRQGQQRLLSHVITIASLTLYMMIGR